MQLLGALNQEEADFDDIVDTIRRDPQLSYRLLQMANSPQVNHGAPITTLQRAATALGLSRIRNWANLLALGKLSDKPVILQQQALFRGYLMQNLSGTTKSMEPDTAFTLGLFSLLDAMLDMPIDEVCARVSLPKELTLAITEHAGPYGKHLKALTQWEKGEAEAIDWSTLEVSPSELEASIEQAIHTVSQQSRDLSL